MSISAKDYWDRTYSEGEALSANNVENLFRTAHAYFGDINGKTLLDLGCGSGIASLYFAEHGASVVAVDLSQVAVRNLTERSKRSGIFNITAVAASAFDIEQFGPVDFIFGNLILHHLEPFDRLVNVLHRTLAVNGKAFFHENSAASDLLIWARTHLTGRFGIPKHGRPDEFPITPGEVRQLKAMFSTHIVVPQLMFLQLAGVYLLRGRFSTPLKKLDTWLYRFPQLRRLSYFQYILLAKS